MTDNSKFITKVVLATTLVAGFGGASAAETPECTKFLTSAHAEELSTGISHYEKDKNKIDAINKVAEQLHVDGDMQELSKFTGINIEEYKKLTKSVEKTEGLIQEYSKSCLDKPVAPKR